MPSIAKSVYNDKIKEIKVAKVAITSFKLSWLAANNVAELIFFEA